MHTYTYTHAYTYIHTCTAARGGFVNLGTSVGFGAWGLYDMV